MHATRTLAATAAALASLMATHVAQAQSAGEWLFKVGANRIAPKVQSDPLSPPALPDSRIDVKAKTSLIVTATYMYSDNLSVELFGGLPYEHDVVGTGGIDGIGKLGTVKQVSPTVLGQWRFGESQSMLRPYVGAGLTYAYFYGSEGSAALTGVTNPGGPPTTMEVKSKLAPSVQLGATMRIDDQWFVDAAVIKTFLKTTTTLSTGQHIDTKLDPLSVGLSLGYRWK